MTSKITEVQELTEVARRGSDSITLRAHIDSTFTIGPKVHGGSLQMVVAKAARTALTALTAPEDKHAEAAAAMIPVAISSDYLTSPDAADIDLEITVRKRGRTVTVLSVDAVQLGRTVVASSVTMARPDSGTPHHSGPTVLDGVPVEPPATGIPLDGSPIAEVNHLGAAIDLVLDSETFPIARGETGEPLVRGWIRPKGVEPDEYFSVLVCDISTTGGDEPRSVRVGPDSPIDHLRPSPPGARLVAVRGDQLGGRPRHVRGGPPRGGLDRNSCRTVPAAGSDPFRKVDIS